jgi:hypothetical protein
MGTQYYGVYVRDGNGEPEALFKSGDKAQAWRKAEYGADEGIVQATENWQASDTVQQHFADTAPAPAPSPAADAFAQKKAEIRSRIWDELQTKALEDEVRAEVEADFAKAQEEVKAAEAAAEASAPSGELSMENTKAELVSAAESRGLDTSGTKEELLERIQEHDEGEEDEEE